MIIILKGGYCNKCGKDFYPKRKYSCPYCGSKDITIVDLPDKGKILSYAIKNDKILALIELTDGCKVIGISDRLSYPDDLATYKIIGPSVHLDINPINGIIKYHFIDDRR